MVKQTQHTFIILNKNNMAKILIFIALIVWMIATLALTISVVGLIVIHTGDWMWMDLGMNLVKKLDNE
jgi:hypothetical protein